MDVSHVTLHVIRLKMVDVFCVYTLNRCGLTEEIHWDSALEILCTFLQKIEMKTSKNFITVLVIRFNVIFSPLRLFWEKWHLFLERCNNLTSYGFKLLCSQIVYIGPYSVNTATAFYALTECSDVTLFVWGRVLAKTHSHFTWPWPGLDSNS